MGIADPVSTMNDPRPSWPIAERRRGGQLREQSVGRPEPSGHSSARSFHQAAAAPCTAPGLGALGHRGHVQWLRVEQLPLTAPDSRGGEGRGHGPSGPLGPVPGPRLSDPAGSAGSAAAGQRFDDGAMPTVPLTARAPVERANTDQFPPQTERAPQKPMADDQDR